VVLAGFFPDLAVVLAGLPDLAVVLAGFFPDLAVVLAGFFPDLAVVLAGLPDLAVVLAGFFPDLAVVLAGFPDLAVVLAGLPDLAVVLAGLPDLAVVLAPDLAVVFPVDFLGGGDGPTHMAPLQVPDIPVIDMQGTPSFLSVVFIHILLAEHRGFL